MLVRICRFRKNITLTGEISLQGKIKPVGGVQAKIYGARQAGIKKSLFHGIILMRLMIALMILKL